MDLYLVKVYWSKEKCEFVDKITTCSAGFDNRMVLFNSSHPRNELEIDIDYAFYAKICLGLTLVSAYIQSFASFYSCWISEKLRKLENEQHRTR